MTLHPCLQELLVPPVDARRDAGYGDTLDEVISQPRLWRLTAALIESRRQEILQRFGEWGLTRGSGPRLVLTGAGSSVHAAMCAAYALRSALGSGVEAVATTDIITGGGGAVGPSEPYILVSIARSGDSPESLAAYAGIGLGGAPRVGNVVLTCNPDGALARAAGPRDLVLVMPDGCNDLGLAMTASYSCMTLAATLLGEAGGGSDLPAVVEQPAACVERFLSHGVGTLADCAAQPFDRAVFLGSGPLQATARECALKLMELTAGRIACLWDSFLGLRHGPQAVVDERCLVVALLDDAPGSASLPYELDLLGELRAKGQGAALLAVGNQLAGRIQSLATACAPWEPTGGFLPLAWRTLTDVVVGQMLGLLASLRLGLRPDNPTPSGIINRVVQGVRIYDPDGLARSEVREWSAPGPRRTD